MLLLTTRYITIVSGMWGLFNTFRSAFFKFYLPDPLHYAASASTVFAIIFYIRICIKFINIR